ncbi:MAG TPA: VWA domain-containing protein [Candidatus Krumholzibacteria bacterium]|nr:VWA domain-containing protein [Candidatus Krumholzibacteria bacterium]
MIEFGYPSWLWGLAAAPLVVLMTVVGARYRRRALTSFVGAPLQRALAPGYSWRRHLAKGLLRAFAVGALFVALAAPRFGSQLVKVERQGIDVVIALDTSLSMLAEDVRPNRLERAKQEIVDVLSTLDGDRVGVVAFAGEAIALCPLTVDYAAALMLVRSVDVYTISEPGSAIAEAIEIATSLFEGAGAGDRAIILVTDGENQEGDPVQAAHAAAEKGIRVFAIGLGSPKGELIPERGSDGSVTGYKKDPRGETVLSRLDEKTLEAVASASKGKYLPATTEGLEIKVLYDEISGMQKKLIKGEFIERKKERFYIPVAVALACLLLDALVTTRATRRRGERARWLHTGAAAAIMLALFAPPATAKDSVDRGKVRSANKLYKKGDYQDAYRLYKEALGDTAKPVTDAPGVYYNGGNALYMQKKYDRALDAYQRSYSPDSALTGNMLYNRANALLKGGHVPEAIESYLQALQYLPDDEDARHNLELALAAKQQQEQQKQQQQQQSGDKGEKQDKSGESQSDSTRSDSQQNQESKPDSTQQQQQQQQQASPDSSMQEQQPDSSSAPLTEEELRKLSPEDAARILQALQEREEELQKERRKAAFRRNKRGGKDW